MIGKLSELLVSGNRGAGAGFFDAVATTSPRSPLDLKMQSPRGLKNYDVGGGIGLGIVAALEKSGNPGGREVLAKYAICGGSNLSRSEPIPVNSGRNCSERLKVGGAGAFDEEVEGESLENYTYVTCRRGPNNPSSFTRVYYDGGLVNDDDGGERGSKPRAHGDFGTRADVGIFQASPGSCTDDFSVFPSSDFLSSCHLCRKKLHGKDIYMYRYQLATYPFLRFHHCINRYMWT